MQILRETKTVTREELFRRIVGKKIVGVFWTDAADPSCLKIDSIILDNGDALWFSSKPIQGTTPRDGTINAR